MVKTVYKETSYNSILITVKGHFRVFFYIEVERGNYYGKRYYTVTS